jgi:hypothetical protein
MNQTMTGRRPVPVCRRPHVQPKAVFAHRAAAGERVADFGNHRTKRLVRTRLYSVALRTPDQGSGFRAGRNRFAPAVEAP